jgi:ribosome biogenesis GTPase A
LQTARWQAHFEQERGVLTFAASTQDPANIKKLLTLVRQMLPEKDASIKSIHTMIVGIPNVGKSTLINILADRVIAKTGNEAAVTKNQQRIGLGNGITLFDTPGILWPKLENPNSGYRLAACGSIKDTAMEYDDVGFFTADYLIKTYPEYLKERFQLSHIPDTEIAFLELAAARRGALMAGGRVNLHKICEVLINEFRSAKIGRISLETPDMIAAEEILMAEAIAKKIADKVDRKEKFKTGSLTPDKHDRKEKRQQDRREMSAKMKADNAKKKR